MDRKHCILLYSNYSQASIDLLSYIKELPLDFPKITGMTMICVDNDQFRETLQKNGVEYVPTLLVEYYKGATPNQTKQKFERDYIYMWIDQVMKALHFEWPQTSQPPDEQPEQPIGHRKRTVLRQRQTTQEITEPSQENTHRKGKVDITALAQQMAKDRDSYISDTTPAHKK